MADICLGVLCRNDHEQLARCVESCRDLVKHTIVIDTGSDRVVDTERALRQAEMPFTLRFSEWVSFGANRNHLLAVMREVFQGYFLLLDADMTVRQVGDLDLTAGSYSLEILDGSETTYRLPLLVRSDQEAFYVGKTHEYLTGWTDQQDLNDLVVMHHCDGSRRPTKFQDDYRTLAAEWQENPNDPRTTFYLANTCRDLGFKDHAVRLYQHRVRLGGWTPEVDAAREQIARLQSGDERPVQVPT